MKQITVDYFDKVVVKRLGDSMKRWIRLTSSDANGMIIRLSKSELLRVIGVFEDKRYKSPAESKLLADFNRAYRERYDGFREA